MLGHGSYPFQEGEWDQGPVVVFQHPAGPLS